MIICTQIRRPSEPTRLTPVVVWADEFRSKFAFATTSPCTELQMRIKVQTDTNQDGVPDGGSVEWSYWEVDKILFGDATKRSQLDNVLHGVGLKASHMRQFIKDQVRAHNESQAPGGTQETYTDIDTD